MPREKNPSILISFRLNPSDANYPNDAKALAVYHRHKRHKKTDRDIMTEALLVLGGYDIAPPTVDQAARRLMTLVNRLEAAIEQLQSVDRSPAVYTDGEKAGQPVNFDFISTILGGLTNRVVDERGDSDDE